MSIEPFLHHFRTLGVLSLFTILGLPLRICVQVAHIFQHWIGWQIHQYRHLVGAWAERVIQYFPGGKSFVSLLHAPRPAQWKGSPYPREHHPWPPRSLSFSGCAWLNAFHFGAARYLVAHTTAEEREKMHFCGTSSGSIVAMALAAGVCMDKSMEIAHELVAVAGTRFFGPAGTMSSIVKDALHQLDLDPQAYKRCNGRLHISISAMFPRDGQTAGEVEGKGGKVLKNRIVSQFYSNEHMLDTILASCYIPIYYEKVATVDGLVCLDGGLTNNQPVVDQYTVTVTPYPGEANVCPEEPFDGLMRLFPASTMEEVMTIIETGHASLARWHSSDGHYVPSAHLKSD